MVLGTLDYTEVFQAAPTLAGKTINLWGHSEWSLPTLICILLFIGAMGKSAQVPLHVWLPDSMEGPTPISALIHAATMVTAGIFMVARMSPLYELSETALSFILVIGAVTAFFMGLLGLVQHDIKRVIAYSTLSQLGYMAVALGASAYAAAIFHLMTHAFFKALLFLAAGSVIIGMHHEQDMRKMGGLWRDMPITWATMLIGTLALIGFPGLSGFFSKDAIIEAVHHSQLPGAGIAYLAVLCGVFVTSLYSFRLLFLVFHGQERLDHHSQGASARVAAGRHGPPRRARHPLGLDRCPDDRTDALRRLFRFLDPGRRRPRCAGSYGEDYHGLFGFVLHGFTSMPFVLAVLGFGTAWICYLWRPGIPGRLADRFRLIYDLLVRKYGFDDFNDRVFAGGARGTGWALWQLGDVRLIDGLMVNGSARFVGWFSGVVRQVQSGYLYHYAFAMIIGLLCLLGYFVYGLG